MKKKIIFLIVILAVAAGGFFYWLWTWQPEVEPDFSIGEPSEAPTLFGKEDYKIEEREDGKFIVVEKVGLTCKVPEGWKIEKEGNDIPEPGYWVNLFSPDAEGDPILKKGCGIGLRIQTAIKTTKEIRDNIKLLQETPERANEIREDYEFEVIEISNYQGLKWLSPEKPILGQAGGVDIPITNENLVSFDTRLLSEYQEKCSPIWEDFLKNVVIE